ncbi:MAG: AAA family ATPase [Ruminococcaceae bacterium]|nr:AAA family ATPase [Oscillospiraceae bacterium]
MICSRCKKRPAVVFITKIENGVTINEGLCLVCAKESGVKLPINDMMKSMGLNMDMSEEEIESVTEQMAEFMEEMTQNAQDEDSDDEFSKGGAASLPSFDKLNMLFKNSSSENKDEKASQNEKGKKGSKNDKNEPKLKYLNTYCQNLTNKARHGLLDNIIGRDEETYRVLQILNRRTKNNPCLIGEPGVGKTAIAEGLAIKIAKGEVPARLANKEVYLLDLTALMAGTQFRGQFESRVKGLVDEIKKVGNVLLVIDEVHNLVGTGGDADGAMNAANMLKPALSRGEIQVIGATTLNEYRKHIEKDSALERRFQPVIINEPSIDDTVKIIMGIKEYYEKHHSVKLPAYLVRNAVTMSERYVTDRYLPDKAIDLIDEACSNSRLNNKKADELEKIVASISKTSEKIEELSLEANEENFEEIANLKTNLLRMEEEKKVLEPFAVSEVTIDDLARVIELWTGIASSKIKEAELGKLLRLSDDIKKRIVGQNQAVELICSAVKRARAGIVPRKRPVSFIFTGPTGVGKTELVKVLADTLFDNPDSLIRLDMSEFMEKHSVSRIIGSPPGYVGYDDAGQLTEKIRRKPYSVVLFDEIEKAHPDVLNVLLQILDDGRITDAHGKLVNFENTFIVMTSNAGSEKKGGAAGFNKTQAQLSKEKALKALSEFLRPEFLNRVDEVVVFSPLERESFERIAELALNELKEGLKERETELIWTEDVVKIVAERSFSLEYGARNVRRTVQRDIEDKIVDKVLNAGADLKKINLDTQDNEITIEIVTQ